MRFIFILFLPFFLNAKNLFFDSYISTSFSGVLTQEYVDYSDEEYYSPNFFLNLSFGYKFDLDRNYMIEPSIGMTFNSGDALQIVGKNYLYNYYDVSLPLMYMQDKVGVGFFIKYLHIPSIEFPKKNAEKGEIDSVHFENKEAYTIGIKGIAGPYFIFYEYLFHGKYHMDYHNTKVDIGGSRIGIGIRQNF